MDEHACPLCGHNKVRKRYKKVDLEESLRRAEEAKAARMVEWNNKAVDARGDEPRRGKVLQQEYWCICFQLGGSKKERCLCSLGPFTDKDREDIPAWYEEYQFDNGDEERLTVSQTVGTLVNEMTTSALEVSMCFVEIILLQCVCVPTKMILSLILKDGPKLCTPNESSPDSGQYAGIGC